MVFKTCFMQESKQVVFCNAAFFSAVTFLAPLQLEGDEFFYSLLHLFFPLGACWPSLWGSESLELVLGGWRFHVQVFWGDPDRSVPQDHQAEPRHAVDHQARAQAPGDARADVGRAQEPRAGQGPQVPPHHRGLTPRCLEEAQHPAAAPLPLGLRTGLPIKICTLLHLTVLPLLLASPGSSASSGVENVIRYLCRL